MWLQCSQLQCIPCTWLCHTTEQPTQQVLPVLCKIQMQWRRAHLSRFLSVWSQVCEVVAVIPIPQACVKSGCYWTGKPVHKAWWVGTWTMQMVTCFSLFIWAWHYLTSRLFLRKKFSKSLFLLYLYFLSGQKSLGRVGWEGGGPMGQIANLSFCYGYPCHAEQWGNTVVNSSGDALVIFSRETRCYEGIRPKKFDQPKQSITLLIRKAVFCKHFASKYPKHTVLLLVFIARML
jgi:hypothetical protein